jgi:hypothetical protein
VSAPSKVYDNEPFVMNIQLQTYQSGGKVKIRLSFANAEIGSTETGTLMDILNRGTTLNLTLTCDPLPWSTIPYILVLDAFWEATLGGTTREASQEITVQVVGIVFEADYEPKTVESPSTFNLTLQIANKGNDVARSVRVELSDLKRFGAEGPTSIQLGDIRSGDTRQVSFTLSSGWLDVFPGQRKVVLTIRFSDWRGVEHSTAVPADVLLRPSQTSLNYWIVMAVVVVAVLLFVLLKAKSVSVGGVFKAKA